MTFLFDDYPDFKPDLTPQDMFKAGILGGSYFRRITSPNTGKTYKQSDKNRFSFLKNIDNDKLITQVYDKNKNYFKVKAGSSYDMWIEKKWINESDAPRGWIHWYCFFYAGRRGSDDERQIKRWKLFASKESGRFRIRFQNIINRLGYNDKSVHPVIQQNLLEWGVDSKKMRPMNANQF